MLKSNFFGALSAFFLVSAIFHFLKKETVEEFLTKPEIIKIIGLVLILISIWGFSQQSTYSKIAALLFFASGIWRLIFTKSSIRYQQKYYPRWVHGVLLGIGALISGLLFVSEADATTIPFPNSIEKYSVSLDLDFTNQSVQGSTLIQFKGAAERTIEFQIHGLKITSVSVDNQNVPFTGTSNMLKVEMPTPGKDLSQSIQVQFHGKPSRGLVWGANYVYTNYDPCGWMICIDDPGIRAAFELEIKIPKKMKASGSGDLISVLEQPQDTRAFKWIEKRPYASYLYGFAAGEFEQHLEKSGTVELEFLGSADSQDDLMKKFKDTQRVLKFFEAKSGVKIPLKRYTQVLVPGNEAQEKQGFSILGKDFVDPILTDPTEDWAIVHELAHQWWGNLLTCKSWEHFWLNEGLTVFMTAAYKQDRWGQSAYDREIELAKKRYQKAIDAKFDVPLTFAGEYPPGLKRPIVYSKGFLFLDALRKEMGEKHFWKGLKSYTQNNQLRSVVTKDFQQEMETAFGMKLTKIFDHWVY